MGTTIIFHGYNMGCHRMPPCGMRPPFSPGCFGFGHGGCNNNMFEFGAGMGLGYAAGMTLLPMLPSAISWIERGVTNLWNNIFHPNKNT